MSSKDYLSGLKKFDNKFKKIKRSRFSLLAYIGTVYLVSIWLIFVNPCLMNIILPILAILVPYKLYGEDSLKKILVAGVVVILLLALTIASFQLGMIYDLRPQTLDSDHFQEGRLEPMYIDGDDTTFNFTVELNKRHVTRGEDMNNYTIDNHTVFLNLTLSTVEYVGVMDYEGYEMNFYEDTNETYKYYKEITDLDERLYGHYFSVRRNMTIDGEQDHDWHTTSRGPGPITLERSRAFQLLTLEYFVSTVVVFLLALGLLWAKKRMDKSVSESVDGLEEKEKELEKYCPECGELLDSSETCNKCGWISEDKEEPDIDDLEEGDLLEPIKEEKK